MSRTLAVLQAPQARRRAEVCELIYQSLRGIRGADPPTVDPVLAAFIGEVTERYPELADWPDDEIDDCPWDEPFEVSGTCLVLQIAEVWWDEILPWLLELAKRHGLTAFDAEAERVYLPRRRPGP